MEDIFEGLESVPGIAAYESSSEVVNSLLSICIVTEGAVEEVAYFQYVKEQLANHQDVKIVLNIVNETISDSERNVSNPQKRYEQMKNWLEINAPTEGLTDVQDEEWLGCDRDNSSFSEVQYDFLLDKVYTDNLHLVVSNPAFQIWLLFHFESNIDALNLDSIEKSSDRIRVIEPQLELHVPDYVHGSLEMATFSKFIKIAVDNSSNYPTNLLDLKTKSGTNFRDIISRTMPWL